MKVILINGSPHSRGCTYRALLEVENTLNKEGVETEIIQVGGEDLRGCIACGICHSSEEGCVMGDMVNDVAVKFEQADGIVVGSPVYYSSPNGTLISFLDRLFYSTRFDKTMKVGACVVTCRRSGNTATYDMLNKYFGISSMPICTSKYWNQVHGACVEDVEEDEEGLQCMRVLGRNMAFLLKSIALGKHQYGLPDKEKPVRTNFIR